MKTRKNDHPGYSCERTPWVLVTGVEPLKPIFFRPACVLRRLPFNGMKPTFRHRRPKKNVLVMADHCNKFVYRPVNWQGIFSLSALRRNGERAAVQWRLHLNSTPFNLHLS